MDSTDQLYQMRANEFKHTKMKHKLQTQKLVHDMLLLRRSKQGSDVTVTGLVKDLANETVG